MRSPYTEHATPQPRCDPSGYSHVVTFLSVGAAYRLGLHDRYALVFGVIAGYVVSGITAGNETDFEQDIAMQLLNEGVAPGSAPLGTLFNTDTAGKMRRKDLRGSLRRCTPGSSSRSYMKTAAGAGGAMAVEQPQRTTSCRFALGDRGL